ncbi:MAG: DUF2029 domain-containing protein [Candidatus Omnitrophica bacterium]|nr:DUF2029 domain-containing protein [Candidatus Omnitrophota bacterium]
MNKKQKQAVLFLIFVIFIGNIVRYSHRSEKRAYADFRVYYATAERFIQKENIYARPDESITPYKYSPMFAMIMAPLGFLSQKQASLVFFTINFVAIIAILMLAKRFFQIQDFDFKQTSILYFLSILFTSRFILLVTDSGQVGLLILLLVIGSLYLLWKDKPLSAALCLAVSIMIKYMPIIFLPYFLIKKKYKFVAATVLFLILFSFVPAVYVGFDVNLAYLKNWLPFISDASFDQGSWFDTKNQSIYSLFLRILTGISGAMSFQYMLLIGIFFGACIYLSAVAPLSKGENSYFIECSILMVCLALFNPNAWMHNYVVLVFAYMLFIYYHMKTKFQDKIGLGLMILSFVLTSWVSETMIGEKGEEFFEMYSNVTIGALILVVALLRIKYNKFLLERFVYS